MSIIQSKPMSLVLTNKTKRVIQLIVRKVFLEFGLESGAGIAPSVNGLVGKCV